MNKRVMLVMPAVFICFLLPGCVSVDPGTGSSGSTYVLKRLGSSEYTPEYWKPHSYNLNKAEWDITFGDNVTMRLNNNAQEFGHIACGAWWVPNFKFYFTSGVSAGIDMALGFVQDVHGIEVAKKIATAA